MTHSFAQATPKLEGPEIKIKFCPHTLGIHGWRITARRPRLLATTLAAVETVCSLADASLIRNQQITWILWTGYSRKPGCSWFPAGQPRAGLWVEDGLAETLALQATRINGGCRHQTIAHPPTVG